MVVISVSITESVEQIVAGFPKTISLSTNIPATIFYTIDGSTPTTLSLVYVDSIVLPTDVLDFTLKAFATNGTDTSAIISQSYSTNILNNTRLPHASTSDVSPGGNFSQYPFGTNSPSPKFDYVNSAQSGTTVDNPQLPVTTFGYDANGNPIGSNQPFDDYLNVYSTTNYKNQALPGVGDLPGEVKIIGNRTPLSYKVEESKRSSGLFDPRAMVIFQDASTDDPSNPMQINPQMFSLENLEITKDGAVLHAAGLDTPTITGSFLKSHYNPRTQTITSYYRDSSTNQWIISTYPYQPKQSDPGNLAGMVFPRQNQGAGMVFTWNLFRYRTLT